MKASVTPRIGSGGPISMWLQTEDMARAEVRETVTTRRASIMVRFGKMKSVTHTHHRFQISTHPSEVSIWGGMGILQGSARRPGLKR